MLLGIDHTELGSWVCRHWRFTSDVTDAIAGHHHPPPSGALTLIDIVHVADAITHALDLAEAPTRPCLESAPAAWARLDLQERTTALLASIESEFNDLYAVLKPAKGPMTHTGLSPAPGFDAGRDVRRADPRHRGRADQNQPGLEGVNSKLSDAQSKLIQSEKLASIGQLAAGVAHEINNPIGFIFSNFGTLEQYLEDLFQMLDAYEQAEASVSDGAALARIRSPQGRSGH